MTATHVRRVGPEAFDGLRLRAEGRVLVTFSADWCPHCDRFLPEVDALLRDGYSVLLADVTSEESDLWDRFAIAIVPTVLVFQDGDVVARFDGVPGVGLRPAAVQAMREVSRSR